MPKISKKDQRAVDKLIKTLKRLADEGITGSHKRRRKRRTLSYGAELFAASIKKTG